jgi:hypothetical protein
MPAILVPDLIVPRAELLALSPTIMHSLAEAQQFLAALPS